MKGILKLIITTLFLSSCNSNSEKNDEIQTINPNEIRQNETVNRDLSEEQILKIKKIHSVFQEVDNRSLEQTITDFKRDMNPDKEIMVWMKIVDAYQNCLNSKEIKINSGSKKEIFNLILAKSMMASKEDINDVTVKILSKQEVEKVLSFYKAEPDPIDVIQK
ncbi:MAG: hypothetical protein HYR91_14940 [Flavobacteriia bacterium]|nr:hypothetical protein [Flavobacteriia bacterium]